MQVVPLPTTDFFLMHKLFKDKHSRILGNHAKNTGEKSCFQYLTKHNRHCYSHAFSFFFPIVCCLCPVCSCLGRWAILLLSWVLAHGEGWEDAACPYPSPPRQQSCAGEMLPWSIWEIQGGRVTVTHCPIKGKVTMRSMRPWDHEDLWKYKFILLFIFR